MGQFHRAASMGASKIYAMLSVILAPMTPFYNDRYKLALVDLPGPMVGAWLLIQGFIGGEPLSLLFGLAAIAFTFLKRHKSYDNKIFLFFFLCISLKKE